MIRPVRIVNAPTADARRMRPLARACVLHAIDRCAIQVERCQAIVNFRADADMIRSRRTRTTQDRNREICITLRLVLGREIELRGLDRFSTYKNLYDLVKLQLGIPLRKTTTSLALLMTIPGPRSILAVSEIVPCTRTPMIQRLRGATLTAVTHE